MSQSLIKESVEEFIKRKTEEFSKNNSIQVKDIGRKGKLFFVREAWTFMPQGNLDDKVFIIERFRKDSTEGELAYTDSWKKGAIEYRIGYFIVGKIGRAIGRWVWGQYCPLIPQEDLNKLLDKAKEEGTLL
ncbi:MAG TPA: hypothetical protein VMW04_01930 [Patescibacteria group bacterium]|nr:hypothetical protein [Patescibacteria group bacterium]